MTDLIPAKQAVIVWNWKPGTLQPSEDVAVLRHGENPETLDLYSASAGAVTAGWCEGSDSRDWPDGVFGHVIFNRPEPVPRPVIFAWLTQFGLIAECEWARRMLAEMVRHNRLLAGD